MGGFSVLEFFLLIFWFFFLCGRKGNIEWWT